MIYTGPELLVDRPWAGTPVSGATRCGRRTTRRPAAPARHRRLGLLHPLAVQRRGIRCRASPAPCDMSRSNGLGCPQLVAVQTSDGRHLPGRRRGRPHHRRQRARVRARDRRGAVRSARRSTGSSVDFRRTSAGPLSGPAAVIRQRQQRRHLRGGHATARLWHTALQRRLSRPAGELRRGGTTWAGSSRSAADGGVEHLRPAAGDGARARRLVWSRHMERRRRGSRGASTAGHGAPRCGGRRRRGTPTAPRSSTPTERCGAASSPRRRAHR